MTRSQTDLYDYIVVGGGSAGCVTANRLVVDHGARVLSLEAGGTIETCCSTCLRALLRYSLGKSNHIRRFQSVPQPSLDGRTIEMIQGNVIGGGSSINALAYTRGVRADYDAWHRSVGGAGWGWEDLLPYFTRQEGNSTLGAPAHGIVGPLDAMLKAFDGRTRVRDSVMGRCVVRSIKSLLNR